MDMSDKKEMTTEEIIYFLWREIHQLRSGEAAFMRIVHELSPNVSAEVFEILKNYPKYKEEESEKILLALESQHPALAAELDKERPLLPPDEKET